MIVIHGWWDDGLVLWAESSDLPPEPPRRRGRRPRVQDHPFAVAGADLAAAAGIAEADGERARQDTAVLALPTVGRGPSPAPDLEGMHPLDKDPPPEASGHWRVPTLVLDAATALDLLRAGPDPTGDRPTWSPDLRCVAALALFALDLAARCRVLPGITAAGPGRARAHWRPVVTGADAAWLRAAVAALPASFSARVEAEQGPAASAAAAVDALVDAAVRASLGPGPARRPTARPATEWRAALRGRERTFDIAGDDLVALSSAVADWQADAVSDGAVRACFRLVEPQDLVETVELQHPPVDEPDEPSWRLEFALQAAEEPSLVVDAERVWNTQGTLRGLGSSVADPQETLLRELGRAVRLYPQLDAALRTARPQSLPLDTSGAHAFLSEAAPLLVAAGFGMLLPGWWMSPSARLGARLRATTPTQPGATAGPAVIGQDGLVDFDWQLAVGDESLTEAEVQDLVEAQQPLVRLRGQWMQVDTERLAGARRFLTRRGRPGRARMTLGEVLHALGSPDDGPGGLPVLGVDAEGWLGDLLSPDRERRLEQVPAPPSFTGTLRAYQGRGLSWLSFIEAIGMGGLLADDMGLGKTVQLLALVAGDPEDAAPTLLVCPMSVVGNWEREAARFTPDLRVHVHHGAERPRGKAFEAAVTSSDLVVTTYSLLARDAAALRTMTWHRLVLDEAQAVKNAATRAAVAARSVPARHRFAVTGTPVENRLADLWSLMEFANPGMLGTATSFKSRFAKPIERHGDAEAGRRLRALTQPFVLRRLKTDSTIIDDLPDKLEMEVVCSLTREQASLYQGVVTEMMERIATTSGMERRGLVLATMTRLKQVCNHPAQFLRDGSRLAGRSGKLARLDETLEEVLASGEKALLFTQYAEFGEMLRSHLTARFGREVAYLHGGVAKRDRDTMVARFQGANGAGPPLFVLSLKAGGTGLTLTAANHVIHVDRWWNPAVEDQATDRAFRIGQTRTVQVRKLVCAGTLEEKIAAMIRQKKGLAESIVGSGEGWLTELSTAQLRQLLTLEAGSVVE